MPSISVPAALAIGAGVSGLGAVASSVIGGNAAKSAATTQANAANQAAQIQQAEFNTTTANEQPFLAAGNTSLNALMAQLGLGPGGTGTGTLTPSFTPFTPPPAFNPGQPFSFNPSDLQNTPGYQFQLQQGEQAITDQASATGGVGGGNTLKALINYGQGLAGTEFQNAFANAQNTYQTNFSNSQSVSQNAYANAYQAWLANQQGQQGAQQQTFNNLQTLAGSGQNAAANLGSLGAANASAVGNDITSGANAKAAGLVGAANATASGLSGVTNAISGAGSNYLLYSLLNGGGAGTQIGQPIGGFADYSGGGIQVAGP